jgi:multiple sugar transport system ATP-binding protein
MHGGVVQQIGSPLELYDRPANLFVAAFIGSPGMNFLAATYAAGSVRLADGTLIALDTVPALAAGESVTLGIRPEHVVIANDGSGMAAAVELVEPTGFGIILHLSLHGLPFKVFTLNREALTYGKSVSVQFPPRYLHLFGQEKQRIA